MKRVIQTCDNCGVSQDWTLFARDAIEPFLATVGILDLCKKCQEQASYLLIEAREQKAGAA